MFKDLLKLSLGIKIKTFEMGKYNSCLEDDTYCLELLAHTMMIKF